MTAEDVKRTMLAFQADVAASTSILVSGGGATGIEFAAEVASLYGATKKVTVRSFPLFLSAFFARATETNQLLIGMMTARTW